MTYLKTLIALTTLALLTACAGGVTINPVVNNNNGPTAATCTANPFATGCTTTPTQQATFCRDKSKITDTKDSDCAPTVIRLCGENPFETGLCTEPTPTEAEAFCSDDNKSTATKANDCIPTISRVCGENPFEAGLCFDDNTYEPTRVQIRATCDNADGANTPRHALCPDIVVTECTADPFLAVCRLGTAGADDGTYGLERTKQIAATCPNNVHDIRCHGEEPYETTRQGILSNCEANVGTGNACPADVVVQVCLGNPYNTVLCNDPDIDYTAQRLIRLNECKTNNMLDGCAAAAETTCPANPFQAGICFIDDTTYMSQRDTQTQNCRANAPTASNCDNVLIAVCNADKFDAYCMGATDYIDAQRNECALATATTAECNMVFATALARCLEDPFSVACDTEATFMDSKVAVRTSRFGFCETDQTNDARCAGYRTCNVSATFAPITCGTDFNPVRMVFCGTTLNAFDPLCTANNLADTGAQMAFCMITQNAFDGRCVEGLKNAAAQLAYCKLSTSDPFGTDCGGTAFKEARVEFCMAKPTTLACDTDLHGEELVYNANPCEGLSTPECTVEVADLPTYPATPNATTTNEFLAITATTASSLTAVVPTTLYITESTTNGMAFFTENSAYYAGILAGTDLGAPIVETTTTALKWQGDFRAVAGIAEAVVGADNGDDFELDITFDGDEGTIDTLFNVGGTGFYYSIDGTFDDKGVISGDILFGTIVGVRENRQIVTDHENYSPGTLTGLIGQNGAVGAFISGHETLVAGSKCD